jgi:hypothetical protein
LEGRFALAYGTFKQFHELETKTCPFTILPEARRGQWGEGLTAAEKEKCRWLKPRLVARRWSARRIFHEFGPVAGFL